MWVIPMVSISSIYKAGVKHGDWKKYLDTGELYFTITYDQGKEVKYDGEALDDKDIIKE